VLIDAFRLLKKVASCEDYQLTRADLGKKIHTSMRDPINNKQRLRIEAIYYAVWYLNQPPQPSSYQQIIFTFVDRDGPVTVVDFDPKMNYPIGLTGNVVIN
jgi:hypothetical protein